MSISISDQLLKDKIQSAYAKKFGVDIEHFSNEALKIHQLIDLKKKLDKDIIDYYEDIIVIPVGSEDTLILDLRKFNMVNYGKEFMIWPNDYEKKKEIFEENQYDNKIYVDNLEEKTIMLDEIKDNVYKGKYEKLKINTPLTMTAAKFDAKFKSLRSRFRETYGSKIFREISNIIAEHHKLYSSETKPNS